MEKVARDTVISNFLNDSLQYHLERENECLNQLCKADVDKMIRNKIHERMQPGRYESEVELSWDIPLPLFFAHYWTFILKCGVPVQFCVRKREKLSLKVFITSAVDLVEIMGEDAMEDKHWGKDLSKVPVEAPGGFVGAGTWGLTLDQQYPITLSVSLLLLLRVYLLS